MPGSRRPPASSQSLLPTLAAEQAAIRAEDGSERGRGHLHILAAAATVLAASALVMILGQKAASRPYVSAAPRIEPRALAETGAGAGQCSFATEPGEFYYWEEHCTKDMPGCMADGQHVQCRFCGKRHGVDIECPEDQCTWGKGWLPAQSYYWDEQCESGMLGCWADGKHSACRFCGGGPYSSITCQTETRTTTSTTTTTLMRKLLQPVQLPTWGVGPWTERPQDCDAVFPSSGDRIEFVAQGYGCLSGPSCFTSLAEHRSLLLKTYRTWVRVELVPDSVDVDLLNSQGVYGHLAAKVSSVAADLIWPAKWVNPPVAGVEIGGVQLSPLGGYKITCRTAPALPDGTQEDVCGGRDPRRLAPGTRTRWHHCQRLMKPEVTAANFSDWTGAFNSMHWGKYNLFEILLGVNCRTFSEYMYEKIVAHDTSTQLPWQQPVPMWQSVARAFFVYPLSVLGGGVYFELMIVKVVVQITPWVLYFCAFWSLGLLSLGQFLCCGQGGGRAHPQSEGEQCHHGGVRDLTRVDKDADLLSPRQRGLEQSEGPQESAVATCCRSLGRWLLRPEAELGTAGGRLEAFEQFWRDTLDVAIWKPKEALCEDMQQMCKEGDVRLMTVSCLILVVNALELVVMWSASLGHSSPEHAASAACSLALTAWVLLVKAALSVRAGRARLGPPEKYSPAP